MTRQAIFTPLAPRPVASYSQAIRAANILMLAGQGGFDPAANKLVGPEIEAQTRQALQNLQNVLTAAGASWDDVVSVRVFVTDHAEFAGMNAVYGEFMSEPFPARTTVFCRLAPGMKVEIEAMAVVGP